MCSRDHQPYTVGREDFTLTRKLHVMDREFGYWQQITAVCSVHIWLQTYSALLRVFDFIVPSVCRSIPPSNSTIRASSPLTELDSSNFLIQLWEAAAQPALNDSSGHLGKWKQAVNIILACYHLLRWRWSCWHTQHIKQTWSNISIHLESNFWPPADCESNIHSAFRFALDFY